MYTKTIKFKVRSDLLDSEIGQIFNSHSEIDYVGYKAMTKDTDWCSLIRQKINNIYTRYFDENVILRKDYMDLLKTPYNLYYRWIKGAEMNASELTEVIEDSIYQATKLKAVYQKQKMDKSWDEYKKKIEEFLLKIFNNCKQIEEYELENLTNKYIYELSSEDNFYIKYVCKYLEQEIKQYQKEYYKLKSYSTTKQHIRHMRCKECGKLIKKSGNKKMYCEDCANEVEKRNATIRKQRQRQKNKDVTK